MWANGSDGAGSAGRQKTPTAVKRRLPLVAIGRGEDGESNGNGDRKGLTIGWLDASTSPAVITATTMVMGSLKRLPVE